MFFVSCERRGDHGMIPAFFTATIGSRITVVARVSLPGTRTGATRCVPFYGHGAAGVKSSSSEDPRICRSLVTSLPLKFETLHKSKPRHCISGYHSAEIHIDLRCSMALLFLNRVSRPRLAPFVLSRITSPWSCNEHDDLTKVYPEAEPYTVGNSTSMGCLGANIRKNPNDDLASYQWQTHDMLRKTTQK
jgi:hypothetical protein